MLEAPLVIETIELTTELDPETVGELASWLRRRTNLRHRYLEPVLDQWREPHAMHAVMPMFATTLDDELAVGPFDLDRSALLAVQLGSALEAVDAAGLVHGSVDGQTVFSNNNAGFVLGCLSPVMGEGEQVADVAGMAQLLTAAVTGQPTDDNGLLERMLVGAADPVAAAAVLLDSQLGEGSSTAGELSSSFVEALGVDGQVAALAGAWSDNPYPGLHSFSESEEGDFHGREAFVDELCERWRERSDRLLVVTGGSGSGKSSVLRAGLVPALRRGAIGGSERWAIATMRPGLDPFGALGEAIASVSIRASSDPAGPLRRSGGDQSGPSEDVLGTAVSDVLGPEMELVLVIDQFEELFTADGSTDDGTADAFLDVMARGLQEPGSQLRIAMGLRADWLDRPLQRQPFAGLFRKAIVPLAPLTVNELGRAIARPALERGVKVSAKLRSRLVSDFAADSSALPLLSVALHELWESRTNAEVIDLPDYEAIGGISGGLVGRAEAAVDSLGAERTEELRRLFGRIVIVGPGRRPTQSTAPLADVLASGVTQRTVDAAIAARLIALDRDPVSRLPMLTPSHETVLERWPRLADWLREDGARLYEHNRLTSMATAWQADGRDNALLLRGTRLARSLELLDAEVVLSPQEAELVASSEAERARIEDRDRKLAERRRNLTMVASIVAILAVLAGAVAVVQSRRAERAATDAEIRLMTQAASTGFDERPAFGLHLAIGAVARGGGADAEAVLIDLLGRTPFDRQLGTAIDTLCVAMSTNPARPAVASFGAAGDDGRNAVTIWDLKSGESAPGPVVELPHLPCPRLSPGGGHVAVTDRDGLRVIDLSSGDVLARTERGQIRDVEWTMSGDALGLLVDGDGSRLDILDAASLDLIRSVPLETDFVGQVALTALNDLAIVTSDARPPLIVDLATGDRRELDDPGERVFAVAVDAGGMRVAARSDANALVWDLESGRLLWSASHGQADFSEAPIAVSETGAYVATVGTEGVVIFDVTTGVRIAEPLPIALANSLLAFVGDEELAVMGPGDRLNVLRMTPSVSVLRDGIPSSALSPSVR